MAERKVIVTNLLSEILYKNNVVIFSTKHLAAKMNIKAIANYKIVFSSTVVKYISYKAN
jgi:hypothetical protein